MPLTNIEYGSLASSEVMNDNFEYLDNRITTVAESLTSTSSSIYSNIESVNNTFTQNNQERIEDISDLNGAVDTLNNNLNTLTNNVNSTNNAPDYSKGVSISMPYTVTKNGYVYAGVNGYDSTRFVKVNGKIVHGHCGYSGGIYVYSGSIFRVTPGDTVTCDLTMGNYYFYPMKGV